jgi:hypothetical protein
VWRFNKATLALLAIAFTASAEISVAQPKWSLQRNMRLCRAMGGTIHGTICNGVDPQAYNNAAIKMYSTPTKRDKQYAKRKEPRHAKTEEAKRVNKKSAKPAVVATPIQPTSPTKSDRSPVAQISSDRRIALVIGNSAYSFFPRIVNPRNDAEDLSDALRGLGFQVSIGTDLKRSDMEDTFIHFARQSRGADTALIFYAGHGLQYNGINYLVPVDAQIEDESDLRKLISLQDVIADLSGASRVRILIVDACRDNGLVQRLSAKMPASRSISFSRGLAHVDGADGTLIAFATQPNRVADDGNSRNSPFTKALLKHLPTPGLELRTLMARVRAEVVAATAGAQRPEVWDSLVGEFAFKSIP